MPAPDAISAALDRLVRIAEAVNQYGLHPNDSVVCAEMGLACLGVTEAEAAARAQHAEERAERDKLARLVQLANQWSDAPTSSRRCRNYNAARFAQAGA